MSTKPVKYFVKAVATIASSGVITAKQVLTPAMDSEDQACDYLNWLNSTISGSIIKQLVRNHLTDLAYSEDFGGVQFVKYASTIY